MKLFFENSKQLKVINYFHGIIVLGKPLTVVCQLGGLNKKEIQLNRCNIFSVLMFNEIYLFA